jgi:N-acetylneuraminate synthase
MATPFDEKSVDLCEQLNLDLIKIASSDINDWVLLEKIAKLNKPVIASTGGSSLKDLDDLVKFFDDQHIPLAINHCVSLYPSENDELDLNQIDFLKNRFPNHVIGFSSHEYHDWHTSISIAYAKGAKTFERHIDIDSDNRVVSPYCSLPQQIDQWFKAFHLARQMSGGDSRTKRLPPQREIDYLDQLVRGAYAKDNLPIGHVLTPNDIYWAIPLLKGQLSCREPPFREKLIKPVFKDQPILIDSIDSPYAYHTELKNTIYRRGVDPTPPSTG